MGLLITAVTGGSSLIEAAKIKAIISDFDKIKTRFYIFETIRNKYPGDTNNDGNIGSCVSKNCKLSIEPNSINFGGEYNGKTVSHQVEPWVDLYLEELSDFKLNPQGQLNVNSWKCDGVGKVYPYFKKISNTCLREFRTYGNSNNSIEGIFINVYSIDLNKRVYGDIFKSIDEKIDDGNKNTGSVFNDCHDYNEGSKCIEMYYKISD